MKFDSYKNIKLSNKIKKEIVYYAISFFFAWLISAFISDFPFFIKKIKLLNIDSFFTNIYLSVLDFTFSKFGFITHINNNLFNINNTNGIILTYGCLGLREFVFFSIFIFFQHGKFITKVLYTTGGVVILFLLNNIRLIIITYSQYIYPNNVKEVHDIVSPLIMYPIILFFWLYWLNKYSNKT
jgi:exosortase/archaeosortase family protein